MTGVFTLFGVWLANRSSLKQLTIKLDYESKKEVREVERVRLEELYSLTSNWAKLFVIHHTRYRKVMKGELTYNEALDLELANSSTIDANRMFTLAELYFPSAHEALQDLNQLLNEASSIQNSFKKIYKEGQSTSEKHAKGLTEVLLRFNTAVEIYKKLLAAYAKSV